MIARWFIPGLVAFTTPVTIGSPSATGGKPNVLLIYVDDLNLEMGTYGHPVVQTPNVDRLAAMGVKFQNAYCPAPVCNASRASTMSGQYTISHRVAENQDPSPEDVVNGVDLLPGQFRNNGYLTGGSGKIFHNSYFGNNIWDEWHRFSHDPGVTYPQNPVGTDWRVIYWGPYENGPNGSLGKMRDTKHVDAAIDMMQRFTEPFFIAVGFNKPHNPLIYPEMFDTLYDPAVDVPPERPEELNPTWKSKVSTYSVGSGMYTDPTFVGSPDDARRAAIAAYWRCVTYIDSEVGRLLDELVNLGIDQETIVIFVSDHGWSNKTHLRWGKDRFWEEDTRIPFLMSVPGVAKAGRVVKAPVNSLDLYPTLMDLCGLPMPAGLEGRSLVPLLEGNSVVPAGRGPYVNQPVQPEPTVVINRASVRSSYGLMLREGPWKLVYMPKIGTHELYDLDADPLEYNNLAYDPAFSTVFNDLMDRLTAAGFLSARWDSYGIGAPGTLGIPTLTASGPPVMGQPLTLNISNSLGQTTRALQYIGISSGTFPVPGGDVLVAPDVIIPFSLPAGGVGLSGTSPSGPGFLGLSIYTQILEVDPGAIGGLSLTPAMELRFGAQP